MKSELNDEAIAVSDLPPPSPPPPTMPSSFDFPSGNSLPLNPPQPHPHPHPQPSHPVLNLEFLVQLTQSIEIINILVQQQVRALILPLQTQIQSLVNQHVKEQFQRDVESMV